MHRSEDREKKGSWQEISMPSNQYAWTSSNSSVLHIDGSLGVVKANKLGFSLVVAEDVNFNEHKQNAHVHVKTPARIELRLHPVEAMTSPHVRFT